MRQVVYWVVRLGQEHFHQRLRDDASEYHPDVLHRL